MLVPRRVTFETYHMRPAFSVIVWWPGQSWQWPQRLCCIWKLDDGNWVGTCHGSEGNEPPEKQLPALDLVGHFFVDVPIVNTWWYSARKVVGIAPVLAAHRSRVIVIGLQPESYGKWLGPGPYNPYTFMCSCVSSQVGYGDILPYTQAEYLICTTCRLDICTTCGGSKVHGKSTPNANDFWSSLGGYAIFGDKTWIERLYSNAGLLKDDVSISILFGKHGFRALHMQIMM